MSSLASIALSLLLAMPLPTVVVRRGAVPGAPPDETDTFIAVWRLEESSGSTRANASANCGSDCNLSDNNTWGQDTSNYVEGSAAALANDLNDGYGSCTISTCDEIVGISGDITLMGWVRWTDSRTGNAGLIDNLGTGGIMAYRDNNNVIRCRVHDGVDTVNASTVTTLTTSTWYHYACTFNDSTDTIQPYINGAVSGSSETQEAKPAPDPAVTFNLGFASNWGSTTIDGQFDEWAIIDQALDPAEVCYACSCGISNWRGCTCSGTSFDDDGVNSSLCGSCTLPICTDPIQ